MDYDTGVVEVRFGGAGANADSLRYNATAYSYLPLDASILGLDPVRLPQDGRVPIFRTGEFAVVGHTGEITAFHQRSDRGLWPGHLSRVHRQGRQRGDKHRLHS